MCICMFICIYEDVYQSKTNSGNTSELASQFPEFLELLTCAPFRWSTDWISKSDQTL